MVNRTELEEFTDQEFTDSFRVLTLLVKILADIHPVVWDIMRKNHPELMGTFSTDTVSRTTLERKEPDSTETQQHPQFYFNIRQSPSSFDRGGGL
jgi:hypothetical protein